jgi:hypothetical protein
MDFFAKGRHILRGNIWPFDPFEAGIFGENALFAIDPERSL